MDYIKELNEIVKKIEDEYNSDHISITKILNYEYLSGQYYLLASQVPVKDFGKLENIQNQVHEISQKFNMELIYPLYKANGYNV